MPSIIVESLPGLEGHSVVLCGDYMIAYGGKTGPRNLNGDVFTLNLTTNQWQRLSTSGAPPAARCYHSAVIHGWRMLVFGGLLAIGVDDIHYNMYNVFCNTDALDEATLCNEGERRLREPNTLRKVTQQKRESNSLFALDLEDEPAWSVVATYGSIPPTRSHHVSTIFRSTMYVFGGYSVHTTARPTDEELKAVSMMYALNLLTMTWVVIDCVESIPPRYWGMSQIVARDTWMLFGGVDALQCSETNAICAFHFDIGEWKYVNMANEACPKRSMHTAVRWGDYILVFGGAGNVSSMLFNDLYCFDLVLGTWSRVFTSGDAPLPRCGHSAAIVGEKMYVFGGMDHAFHRSQRAWALDLKEYHWEPVPCQYDPLDITNIRGVPKVVDPNHSNFYRKQKVVEPYSKIMAKAEMRSEHVQTQSYADDALANNGNVPAETIRKLNSAKGSSLAMEDMYRNRASLSPPRGMSSERAPYASSSQLNVVPEQRIHTYPIAWSNEDEVLQSMRTGIAQSKTVLGNMVDAASSRAERDNYSSSTMAHLHSRKNTKSPVKTRADEARYHLGSEIQARTNRLKELAQTAGGTLHDTASQYWAKELDVLSKENELWRQATEREEALLEQYEINHYEQNQQRSTAANRIITDGLPSHIAPQQQFKDLNTRVGTSMFPHSTPASNKIHDPEHPDYQPFKMQGPVKTPYISPSIEKLGLSNQLGKNRNTGAKQPQFELKIPQSSYVPPPNQVYPTGPTSHSVQQPMRSTQQSFVSQMPSATPTSQPYFETREHSVEGSGGYGIVRDEGRLPSATQRALGFSPTGGNSYPY